MSVPDMRLCAQYAITYPQRINAVINELDLFELGKLTFARPDLESFGLLKCAMECIKEGGALPAVLNASNEVAVAAFLNNKIKFYDITESVTRVVNDLAKARNIHTLDGIIECDREARELTKNLLHV